MNRRTLTYLSMALYLIALFSPAMLMQGFNMFGDEYDGAKTEPLFGFVCLIEGPLGIFLWYPPLIWLANPWLWCLWIRSLQNRRTFSFYALPSILWAAAGMHYLGIHQETGLLIGAWIWLASIVVGAVAAQLKGVVPPPVISAPSQS